MKICPLMEYSKQLEPTAGENIMSKERGSRHGKPITLSPPEKDPGHEWPSPTY